MLDLVDQPIELRVASFNAALQKRDALRPLDLEPLSEPVVLREIEVDDAVLARDEGGVAFL